MVLNFRKLCPIFLGSYNLWNIFKPHRIGKLLCKTNFIITVTVIAFKAYGKGFINLGCLSNIAWINAAWQKRAYLNIGDFMRLNRLANGFINLIGIKIEHTGHGFKVGSKIARLGDLTVFECKAVRRWQLVNALKKRFFGGRILKRKIMRQSLFI